MEKPLLGLFLLFTILFGIGFRPRRPFVIHAYMNAVFFKVFLAVAILGMGGALGWAYLSVRFLTTKFPSQLLALGSLLALAPGLLCMVYVLYWGLPFSRKKKGVKAVDDAIVRYRRPGETVEAVWLPDLVVDGKAYSLVYYNAKGKVSELLGLDLQGRVVRDEDLIKKLGQCFRLAMAVAYPVQINERTTSYVNTQKMLNLLGKGLKRYDALTKPLGEKAANQVQQVQDALLLTREYATALCRMWYLEAEWGQKHGNAHLAQVRYDDVLALSSQMEAYQLMATQSDVMLQGIKAARALQRKISEVPDMPRASSKDLGALFALLIGFEETAQIAREGAQTGTGFTKYMPLTDADLQGWRRRLAWVDKVEGSKK